MHSNALGRVGDFVLVPTSEGFHVGNSGRTGDGPLHRRCQGRNVARGWRSRRGRAGPRTFFDVNLKRANDTDWPAVGGISPKKQCGDMQGEGAAGECRAVIWVGGAR